MIKHIFFDFNGTILNDVELCLGLLNEILIKQGKPTLSMEKYKNIFTFPIVEYYKKAGIDLSLESFDSLAKWYVKKYQPLSLECGLYDNIIETIQYIKSKGICTYILSASERNNLIEQCNHYDIIKLFDDILGIDNIMAASKLDIAVDYIRSSAINPKEALFVGDTLHDFEVAEAIGMKCYLVSCGHQSIDVISKAGVPIIDSVADLRSEF